MTKTELAQRFRSRPELNETRHIYLPDPRSLNTMDRLIYQGGQAERYITEAKALIETMEAYRQLIFDRVQALTTAAYHHEIHLTRRRRYDGKVSYCMELKKVYDTPGIDPERLESTTYPGAERHKALKDFAAYQKHHPGILAVKDIEKSKWER